MKIYLIWTTFVNIWNSKWYSKNWFQYARRFERILVKWLSLTLKPITFSNKEEKAFTKIRDKKSIFVTTKEVALFLNIELFFLQFIRINIAIISHWILNKVAHLSTQQYHCPILAIQLIFGQCRDVYFIFTS